MIPRPPCCPLFPYTTLFRSSVPFWSCALRSGFELKSLRSVSASERGGRIWTISITRLPRSEEHTSELQSRVDLVCRLLLEKKKPGMTMAEPEAQDRSVRG